MLIVISIMFLIFSIPIDIYFLGYAYGAFSDETGEEGAIRWLFYTFVTLAYYTNNAINFFMYFASGRKFRDAFLNTFFCVEPSKRAVTSSSSGTAVTGTQSIAMTAWSRCHRHPEHGHDGVEPLSPAPRAWP